MAPAALLSLCGLSLPLLSSLLPLLTSAAAAPPIAVFPDVVRPDQHPRFATVQTRPITWATLGNQTRFATLRGFSQAGGGDGNITGYQETLAQYAPLGDVIWPVYMTLFAPNLADVAAYMAENDFYLTDLWGYVPGSGPGPEMWQAFTPPPGSLEALTAALGDRFFGVDVGEQDGRWTGAYADQNAPLSAPVSVQRRFFEEHFQRMYEQLGGRLVALQSLTNAHSMAASGTFTVVGCESGQALVNAQLFYASARGAGKVYGLLWFGNVSVYNLFGYKTYPNGWLRSAEVAAAAARSAPSLSGTRTGDGESEGKGAGRAGRTNASSAAPPHPLACTNQGMGGPTCGTSLSLFTKLMLAQLFYNSGYVSFESSWFGGADGDTLTPIGQIQLDVRSFLARTGSPGVHVVPFGLLMDANAGFTAPRHLYTGNLFRVWGNLPYSLARGDFLVDSVLDAVLPSYRDSSFFHDETGFSAPTPFGDSLDLLTSDAPAFLLGRYDTLILASTPQTEPGLLRSKLQAAVRGGTNVVAWAGALGAWGPAGLANCSIAEAAYAGAWGARCASFAAGTSVTVANDPLNAPAGPSTAYAEPAAFVSCTLVCTGGAVATPFAWAGSVPVAWTVAQADAAAAAAGTLVVFGSPFGAAAAPMPVSDPGLDAPLSSSYPFLGHVAAGLDAVLSARTLFSVPGLTYTVARQQPSSPGNTTVAYTLLVSNPTMAQAPLSIASNIGPILSLEELPFLNTSVYSAAGYLPDGYQGTDLGNSTATTIAGVDTRIFRVVVQEQEGGRNGGGVAAAAAAPAAAAAVRVLSTGPPPKRPTNVALSVGSLTGFPVHTLRELITGYPSLPQHFDHLLVDWTYVNASTPDAFAHEAAYLRQTGVSGIVDFTSGLTLFPALRLCNNSAPEYAASLAALTGTFQRMQAAGWAHAVLSLHRTPENNMDDATAVALMGETLAQVLVPAASALGITLHLRMPFKSPVDGIQGTISWLKTAGGGGTGNLTGSLRLFPTTGVMSARGESAVDLADAFFSGGPGDVALFGVSCTRSDWTGATFTDAWPVTVNCPDASTAVAELVAAACLLGACGKEAAAPGKLAVLLVVDAYVGADALVEPGFFDPSQSASASSDGPWLGGSLGAVSAGAAMDLAYQEVRWALGQAGVPIA